MRETFSHICIWLLFYSVNFTEIYTVNIYTQRERERETNEDEKERYHKTKSKNVTEKPEDRNHTYQQLLLYE